MSILTHRGSYVVVFYNVVISALFNCMHRNNILHIVVKIMQV
jgi:hypothetical protein